MLCTTLSRCALQPGGFSEISGSRLISFGINVPRSPLLQGFVKQPDNVIVLKAMECSVDAAFWDGSRVEEALHIRS